MKNIFGSAYVAPAYYLATFALTYYLMVQANVIQFYPTNGNLQQWDAWWFKSLSDNGYQFIEGQQSNSGFFPAFSYFWKYTGLEPMGISIVNLVIYFCGFLLIAREFKLTLLKSLLFLSIPSAMFMMVPYTEALFFGFAAILLVGIKRENLWLACAGLFLCSITRATSMFFIPAIIFMNFFSDSNWSIKKKLQHSAAHILAALSGLFLVVFMQWKATHEWFAFAQAQVAGWKHYFHWPTLGFTSWDGKRLIWLDGTALFTGVVAIVYSTRVFFRKILNQSAPDQKTDKPFLFSCAMLVVTVVYGVFFNHTDPGSNLTTLVSLNRYIFATPFFIIFLIGLIERIKLDKKTIINFAIIFLIVVASLVPGMFQPGANTPFPFYVKMFTYFAMIGFVLSLYFVVDKTRFNTPVLIVLITINLVLQAYCLNGFINAIWIG